MRGTREDVFRGSLRAVALLKGGMAILSGPRCRTAFIALLFRIITTLPNCLALPDRMPSGFVSRSWSFASQASRLVGKRHRCRRLNLDRTFGFGLGGAI